MSGISIGRPFNLGPSRGSSGGPKPMAPLPSILQGPPQGYRYSDVLQHRVQPGFAAAYGPDGKRLTVDQGRALGPLYHAGWNTSGVGPGTPGYRGSWRPGGYNYGEGTGRPSARNSAEYYAQRDAIAGNPLDNLAWNGGRGQPWRPGGFDGNALMQSLVDEARGSAQPPPAAPAGAGSRGGNLSNEGAESASAWWSTGPGVNQWWGGDTVDQVAPMPLPAAPNPAPAPPLPMAAPSSVESWIADNSPQAPTASIPSPMPKLRGFSPLDEVSMKLNNEASRWFNYLKANLKPFNPSRLWTPR